MRELTGHKVNECNEKLEVSAVDQPGSGGANHHYEIRWPDTTEGLFQVVNLRFQNGAIGEVGTNGVTHEALLAILVDRLEAFQKGPYACQENADALLALGIAQANLNLRTERRLAEGKEGTHEV